MAFASPQSGARINISEGNCPERIITLAGPTNAIFKAFAMIIDKLEEVCPPAPAVTAPAWPSSLDGLSPAWAPGDPGLLFRTDSPRFPAWPLIFVRHRAGARSRPCWSQSPRRDAAGLGIPLALFVLLPLPPSTLWGWASCTVSLVLLNLSRPGRILLLDYLAPSCRC